MTCVMPEGWWRVAGEGLRPSPALPPGKRWLDLLSASGFTEPIALPEATKEGDTFSAQALILARAPREDAPQTSAPRASRLAGDWLILADRGGVGACVAERIRAGDGRCVVALPGSGDAAAQAGELTRLWRGPRGPDAPPWPAPPHPPHPHPPRREPISL